MRVEPPLKPPTVSSTSPGGSEGPSRYAPEGDGLAREIAAATAAALMEPDLHGAALAAVVTEVRGDAERPAALGDLGVAHAEALGGVAPAPQHEALRAARFEAPAGPHAAYRECRCSGGVRSGKRGSRRRPDRQARRWWRPCRPRKRCRPASRRPSRRRRPAGVGSARSSHRPFMQRRVPCPQAVRQSSTRPSSRSPSQSLSRPSQISVWRTQASGALLLLSPGSGTSTATGASFAAVVASEPPSTGTPPSPRSLAGSPGRGLAQPATPAKTAARMAARATAGRT